MLFLDIKSVLKTLIRKQQKLKLLIISNYIFYLKPIDREQMKR